MILLNIFLFFMWFFVGGFDWFIDCLNCIEALQAAEELETEKVNNFIDLLSNLQKQMSENNNIQENQQIISEEEPD